MRRSPFVWFGLFLLCAELIALGIELLDPLDTDGYRRNNTPLRNWPEYVSCENRDPDRPLAVLIGASQSMSPEFEDSQRTWFAMVQRRLEEDGVRVDLRNWAVTGIRSDQIELLSLQALRCGASAVIYVLSLANIDEQYDFRFDSHSADVDLLAGEPGIWPMLRGSLTLAHATYDQVAKRVVRRQFALGRARDTALDHLADLVGQRKTYFVAGHVRPAHARVSIKERAATNAGDEVNLGFAIGEDVEIHPEYWRKQIELYRMPVFDAIYGNLDRRFKNRGASLAWAFSAVNARQRASDVLTVSEEFQGRICERLRADGWQCRDLSRSLNEEDFFPAGIGSHFNERGQKAFADLIYPFVLDAVH